MQTIQMFKTADGKTFDDRNVARRHEITLEALEKFQHILKESIATGRPDSILRQILMEESAVSGVLQTFRKKQPKKKQPKKKGVIKVSDLVPPAKKAA